MIYLLQQLNEDGTYILKIKITKNHKTRYYPADIKITESVCGGKKIKSHKLNKTISSTSN